MEPASTDDREEFFKSIRPGDPVTIHTVVAVFPPDPLELTPEERRVMDATIEVMNSIRALYGGKYPANFNNEAIPAIHVLQQFARQHWVHRIAPDYWNDWTDDE